ncbi:MAG TPA: C39 family peptidase [Patescibacteria group bacterium]|nr:C39 family peptidase [Patescibacteria group bacterium]
MRKKILLLLILPLFFFATKSVVLADCDPNDEGCIRDEITQYQQKLSTLAGQANTLSNQIAQFNAQITLTELKITQTEDEINLLTGRIGEVQSSLNDLTKAFSARAVATYEMARTNEPTYLILSSADLNDALSKFHYLQEAQASDQTLLTRLQSAQTTYENSKQQSEDLQTQLQADENSLNTQKSQKQALLTQTQGSEANYQKLLAQAQTQLAAFSKFTASAGGSGLLSNQTDCSDSWGCYYNQRDTSWGSLPLNGTQYTIASDGCLVTSMAMILTHYGHKSVTPITINSDPTNFASYYPAYLNYVIHADGVTATRAVSSIDSTLSTGNPVVVGIHAYGGTHFVVIKSGSNGNYVMNDPYLPNGKNLNFTDHYSISSIFEVDSVSIN